MFVECHAQYRQDGPAALRPVGEVEFVAAAAETGAATPGPEIEGIVGHADLSLGDAVEEVLVALDAAGGGRFRGVRHTTAWDRSPMGNNADRGGLHARGRLPAPASRRLGALGYSFDAMVYHTQILELAALAQAFRT